MDQNLAAPAVKRPGFANVVIASLMVIGSVTALGLILLLAKDDESRYWLAFFSLFVVFAAINRASELIAPDVPATSGSHPRAILEVTEAVTDQRISAAEGAEMIRAIKEQADVQRTV